MKRFLACALLATLTACGGGGGGESTTPTGGVGIRDTGSASGRVEFTTGLTGIAVEAEPNDTIQDAQALGQIPPGGRMTVLGRLSALEGGDAFDGFRLQFTQRVKVTATLFVESPATTDFDLAIYDPVSLQFVEVHEADTSPQTVAFVGKGALDLVLTAVRGEGAYELKLQVDAVSIPMREREPNDMPTQAQFLGEVVAGDSLLIDGEAYPDTDPTDGVFVTCPVAVRLELSLDYPAFAAFALRILDATADLENPVSIEDLDGPASGHVETTIDVAAGTLLYIEMLTYDRGGIWRLGVDGVAFSSSTAKAHAAQLPGRLASRGLEARRVRGRRDRPDYGRVPHAVYAGEAIVRYAAEAGGALGDLQHVTFAVPEGLTDEDRARWTISRARVLAGGQRVLYAEPNGVLMPAAEPDDTYYGLQWHYPLMHLPEAWDITTGSKDVIVAVIDTGRTNHPDLAANQSGGYDMISSATTARDGDGMDPDPTDEGDLSSGTWSSFHGTHVAGTIGAVSNNGLGVAGVCWDVTIMHVRALGLGGGSTWDVANAVLYAARQPNASGALPAQRAHVINMSLGGGGYSQTMADACAAAWTAGVVIFASAGNSNTTTPGYPASYPNVISVMAVDAVRNRAPYSNYGSTVELAAPGGNSAADLNADGYQDGVLSTLYDDSGSTPQPIYAFYQGTSMACPHAAGVAALMLSLDPDLTPNLIRQRMRDTADDLGATGRDDVFGYGLVNAWAAVRGTAPPAPPEPPLLSISPHALNFGHTRTSMDISISNLGDGLLEVEPVTWDTSNGGDWLSAMLVGPADERQTARTLRVSVSRFGLLTGSFLGGLVLASNGGTVEIPVTMAVETDVTPPPNINIRVEAVYADTGEVVAHATVNPAAGLAFEFPVLPVGRYIFRAGTDLDGDGTWCEAGDYCGAFPILGEPEIVQVTISGEQDRLNFPVSIPTSLGDFKPK